MKALVLAFFVPLLLIADPSPAEGAGPLLSEPQWVRVTPRTGPAFVAQKLHSYEARWFWESSGPSYTAYFLPSPPRVKVLAQAEIQSELPASSNKAMDYVEFLTSMDLLLERSPFKVSTFISTGNSGHHLHENMYGDFAWDFEILKNGSTFSGKGLTNTDYHVFGTPVYSPVSGRIADIHTSSQDHEPLLKEERGPLTGREDGNYVLIDIGHGFFVSILHLKKNTLPKGLKKGDRISVGDPLGEVGNSGRTYVPHLHMTTYFYEPHLKRMISVPNLFIDRNDQVTLPITGDTLPGIPSCLNH